MRAEKVSKFIRDLKQYLEDKGVVDVGIVKLKVPDSIRKIGMQQRKKQIYN